PDVERWAVPFDEVLLEVERLGLVLRDDHLDVVHPLRKLLDRGAGVMSGLEIRPDPRPQRLRLPDVEHVPLLVAEQVDARPRRQAPELFFEAARHVANLAVAVRQAALRRFGYTNRCGTGDLAAGAARGRPRPRAGHIPRPRHVYQGRPGSRTP